MGEVLTIESPQLREALGRAAVYELLASAFSYPCPDTLAQLRALTEEVAELELLDRAGLQVPFAALVAALDTVDGEALAAEHNRLFAGQVACSAHETEYLGDPFAKGRQLADVAGFYHAFGVKAAGEEGGPPDFIATELEFMGLLLRKQVLAALEGWSEQELLCIEAQRGFLEDHLGRWIPHFGRQLAQVADGRGLHAAAAALCVSFVEHEADRLGAAPRLFVDRLAVRDDPEEFLCGICPETEPDGAVDAAPHREAASERDREP